MRDLLLITDTLAAGGVERQLCELVTRLDRALWRPRVLCLYGARRGLDPHFMHDLRAADVPVTLIDAANKAQAYRAIMCAARDQPPALIHAWNYHSNLLTRAAHPFVSARLIGSVRTAYSARQLIYERATWRLCAAITCNSPQIAHDLITRARIPSERVQMIPNGVDTVRFAPTDLSRNGFTLLFMGRITRQKAPHLIAEALGLLKRAGHLPANLRVNMVSAIHDAEANAALEQAIARHGLDDVIARFPPTHTPEMYYHAADTLILPSLYEGLPNVMLEALACGIPVIASDAANAAGVIDHGAQGWIAPTNDAHALANAIQAVITQTPEQIARMQSECRARALDYRIERMIAAYEALYDRVLAT